MSLLNRKAFKEYAKSIGEGRAHPLNRVSDEFVDRMEAKLKELVKAEIKALPSVGKTIK